MSVKFKIVSWWCKNIATVSISAGWFYTSRMAVQVWLYKHRNEKQKYESEDETEWLFSLHVLKNGQGR